MRSLILRITVAEWHRVRESWIISNWYHVLLETATELKEREKRNVLIWHKVKCNPETGLKVSVCKINLETSRRPMNSALVSGTCLVWVKRGHLIWNGYWLHIANRFDALLQLYYIRRLLEWISVQS